VGQGETAEVTARDDAERRLKRREIKRAAERGGSARAGETDAIKEEGLSLGISMRDLKVVNLRGCVPLSDRVTANDREELLFPSKCRNADDILIFEARETSLRANHRSRGVSTSPDHLR